MVLEPGGGGGDGHLLQQREDRFSSFRLKFVGRIVTEETLQGESPTVCILIVSSPRTLYLRQYRRTICLVLIHTTFPDDREESLEDGQIRLFFPLFS